MLQLHQILYITDPEAKLCLEGETVNVRHTDGRKDRVPFHQIEQIVSFSYVPVTMPLFAACAQRGIGMSFLTPGGKFRFRVVGETKGNVLLRKAQYTLDEERKLQLARGVVRGKLENTADLLSRFRRNYKDLDLSTLTRAEEELRAAVIEAERAESLETLRGIEGSGARTYFGGFHALIRNQHDIFRFEGRNRRPPKDACNALLSYSYSLLASDCVHALECVGLDPYVGALHSDRPGKPALALDLMEEFRPMMADRLVLTLINKEMIRPDMFQSEGADGVYLNKEGRRILLQERNRRRWKEVKVPEIGKRVPLGLLIHLQAGKMAAFIRGEAETYEPIRRR